MIAAPEEPPTQPQIRLWSLVSGTGLERFELIEAGDGFRLEGTILVFDQQAYEVRYRVQCDAQWRTTAADIDLHDAAGERRLSLVTGEGRWHAGGREIEGVRGALDVDLGWSPSTNTLPVRRLQLAVGERRDLTAAWVRFPQLAVEPLPQSYTRTGQRTWLYESRGGTFSAALEVDEHGLVVDYQGLWRRIFGGP